MGGPALVPPWQRGTARDRRAQCIRLRRACALCYPGVEGCVPPPFGQGVGSKSHSSEWPEARPWRPPTPSSRDSSLEIQGVGAEHTEGSCLGVALPGREAPA